MNPVALRLQVVVLSFVRVVFMSRTVNLDRQPLGYAGEVDNVGPDRYLAPKLEFINLPASKARPHASLGLGHVVPQPAGAIDLRRVHGNQTRLRIRPSQCRSLRALLRTSDSPPGRALRARPTSPLRVEPDAC